MKKSLNTKQTSTLDEYIYSLYSCSEKDTDYTSFSIRAKALSSHMPANFWHKSSEDLFKTLLTKVKENVISIDDTKFLVTTSTLFEGFRTHLLNTMSADSDMLKGRVKRPTPTLNFDSLDNMLTEKLTIQM